MKFHLLMFSCAITMLMVTSCKNSCADIDCQNGGYCIDGECNCPDGYAGSRCQIDEACRGITCQNGGTCDQGTCKCPAGYTGNRCQTRDLCAEVRCNNGGTCINGKCTCKTGFTGPNCNTRLSPKGFRINAITVKAFPPYKQNNTSWDDNGGLPDIILRVYKNDVLYTSSGYIRNCSPNTTHTFRSTNFPILLNSMNAKWTITAYDYDFGTSADDYMGGYFFYLNNNRNGYPSTITLRNSSTWHDIQLELAGEWIF